jgi:ATP-binding cassette subfamily C protein
MERGLETIIGEGGTRLSGGERQRIAIARALLRRPRLLVLDEATNAIDIASESKLLERLAEFDPRPTIIMVSHRAESLVRCDQIATIERGRPPVVRLAARDAGESKNAVMFGTER